METVANLVNTVEPNDIEITVNGSTVKPTAFTPPTVTAPPDQDCEGAWGNCIEANQKRQYAVTTVQSGAGKACDAAHGATDDCLKSRPSVKNGGALTGAGAVSALMLAA